MSKKEKIAISRSDDFALVEEELNKAMESLDDANARIEVLLQSQQQPSAEAADQAAPSQDPDDGASADAG